MIVAFAILAAIVLLPAHPKFFRLDTFTQLPLELPALALALLLVHGRAFELLRAGTVVLFAVVLLSKLADLGSQAAFSRPFSPLSELHLLKDGWNLASAAIGIGEAAAGVLLAVGLLGAICVTLYIGLGALRDCAGPAGRMPVIVCAVLLGIGVATLALGRAVNRDVPVQAKLVPHLVERVVAMNKSVRDQSAYVTALAIDPLAARSAPVFGALAGLDVIVLFVESYGRSYVDLERFAGAATAHYLGLDATLESAGLHVKSGWLTSSVRGGRSWLAQATFASGTEVSNQARFDLLVTSDRKPVNALFREEGWRTVGLMPAIQYAWPEGAWYDFDETYDKHALGYRGEPVGWVTMPDQYTLSHFERAIRPAPVGALDEPVMATIALISSHAPWTPLSTKVPWAAVGDGSVFDGSHRFGDPVSWSERDRVQEMYAKSIEYSLDIVIDYAARHGQGSLIIAFGDHQPASVVDGWGATADTPIHLISDDPTLLERLPPAFFGDGMRPTAALRSLPMSSMRERLAEWFSIDRAATTEAEAGNDAGSDAAEARQPDIRDTTTR